MVLNFQKRFESKIRSKQKRHTIRAERKGKRQIRVGDRLDCYVGLRHKGAYLLGRWPCVKIDEINIAAETLRTTTFYFVRINGQRPLMHDEADLLAKSDGFDTFYDMMEFWEGRLPFHGVMIHWDPDRPQQAPRSRKSSTLTDRTRQTKKKGII